MDVKKKVLVDGILSAIYNSDLNEKDFASIMRKIHQRLADSFEYAPPTRPQFMVMKALLEISDAVETFYGNSLKKNTESIEPTAPGEQGTKSYVDWLNHGSR